jgi:hypothetical protein
MDHLGSAGQQRLSPSIGWVFDPVSRLPGHAARPRPDPTPIRPAGPIAFAHRLANASDRPITLRSQRRPRCRFAPRT